MAKLDNYCLALKSLTFVCIDLRPGNTKALNQRANFLSLNIFCKAKDIRDFKTDTKVVVTKKDYQGLRYVDYLLQLTCCHYTVEESTRLHSFFFHAFIENCKWLHWLERFFGNYLAEVLRRRANKQAVVETREKASKETL